MKRISLCAVFLLTACGLETLIKNSGQNESDGQKAADCCQPQRDANAAASTTTASGAGESCHGPRRSNPGAFTGRP